MKLKRRIKRNAQIREVYKRSGVSQKILAELFDISQPMVSKIVREEGHDN